VIHLPFRTTNINCGTRKFPRGSPCLWRAQPSSPAGPWMGQRDASGGRGLSAERPLDWWYRTAGQRGLPLAGLWFGEAGSGWYAGLSRAEQGGPFTTRTRASKSTHADSLSAPPPEIMTKMRSFVLVGMLLPI